MGSFFLLRENRLTAAVDAAVDLLGVCAFLFLFVPFCSLQSPRQTSGFGGVVCLRYGKTGRRFFY
jgi:hypothetical protein